MIKRDLNIHLLRDDRELLYPPSELGSEVIINPNVFDEVINEEDKADLFLEI